MIKTYKAKTNVSINVVLANKKNLHISFNPLSNGSSTYTTDNEEIIKAIESHYNFGKLFRVENVESSLPGTYANTKKEMEHSEVDAKGGGCERGTQSKRVKVPDIASAKDYLADVCGISRTMLRTEKSIYEQAQACGIEFYGINSEER